MADPQMNQMTSSLMSQADLNALVDRIKKGFQSRDYTKTSWDQAPVVLEELRNKVKEGTMSLTQYNDAMSSIAPVLQSKIQERGGSGSTGADAAKQVQQPLFDSGYFVQNGSKWDVGVPFSRSEYDQLPEQVLPTQAEIDDGTISNIYLPTDRVRSVPAAPPTLDPTTGQPVGDGTVGDPQKNLGGKKGVDQTTIENEGQRQQSQDSLLYTKQQAERKKQVEELRTLLAGQRKSSFDAAVPQLAEQANTKGILRSTGFGDILANKYKDLAAAEDFGVGAAQIGYNDAGIDQETNILAKKQAFQSAGLQRSLGLKDAEAQAILAKQLADLAQPKSQGKSGSDKWAQGLSMASSVMSMIPHPAAQGAAAATKTGSTVVDEWGNPKPRN